MPPFIQNELHQTYCPAEWEPHRAAWLTWPHNPTDWPGKTAAIQWVYGEIVQTLTPYEEVCVLVNSKQYKERARRTLAYMGVDLKRVTFYRVPTDRSWIRDYGPLFIRRKKPRRELAIARFQFNGWARYKNWHNDNRVPQRIAHTFKRPLIPVTNNRQPAIFEGGSIDTNGQGSLLTTEECLLDKKSQARNPELSRADLERIFADALGIHTVIWLGRGIAGDDTHGHVDDIARFVGPDTSCSCRKATDATSITNHSRKTTNGFKACGRSKGEN